MVPRCNMSLGRGVAVHMAELVGHAEKDRHDTCLRSMLGFLLTLESLSRSIHLLVCALSSRRPCRRWTLVRQTPWSFS